MDRGSDAVCETEVDESSRGDGKQSPTSSRFHRARCDGRSRQFVNEKSLLSSRDAVPDANYQPQGQQQRVEVASAEWHSSSNSSNSNSRRIFYTSILHCRSVAINCSADSHVYTRAI
jgi:hypothetical protein